MQLKIVLSFLLKIKLFINNAIISNIGETNKAFYCNANNGPDFGNIILWTPNESTDYTGMVCKKRHHEKRIRDTEGEFIMEDYEIFQIFKR